MKFGIIGAMDVEVASIKEKMNIKETRNIAGQDYCDGSIGDNEVVVVKCGVGKVRAGLAVQVLKSIFNVDAIINTGVAGSLNNDINIGDIVVSTDAVYHDVDATNFGYQLGEVPQMGKCFFEADAKLRDYAKDAIKNSASDINYFDGRIASGDQFICTKDKKEWIKDTFKADCCEMEGCAIAQASYVNGLPFVILRAISDKADESVSESYDVFEGKAAKHCADVVYYMINHIK